MDLLITLFSFVLVILILVGIHEFGHFWLAYKLGVKVHKFSIGFGPTLYKRTFTKDKIEFILAAIPLGGYVKMLDAREGEVAKSEQHREFTSQALWKRFLIVVAGPVFNFLFAIVLYCLVFLVGESGFSPIVGKIEPSSIAAQAEFKVGDKILAVEGREVKLWRDAITAIVESAIDQPSTAILIESESGKKSTLTLKSKDFGSNPQKWIQDLGLSVKLPDFPAVVGTVMKDSPAEIAGLLPGDKVLKVDNIKINAWQELVAILKVSAGKKLQLDVQNSQNEQRILFVVPRLSEQGEKKIGLIGVSLAQPEQVEDVLITVHYGLFDAIGLAIVRTARVTALTFGSIVKMVTGEIAAKDSVGGPITIAKYAGNSFLSGFSSFLGFLAMISIGLGVLNLLPIPALDGGHLLLYLIEFVKGSPLPEKVEMLFQKIGVMLIACLIFFVFYVDINRLL